MLQAREAVSEAARPAPARPAVAPIAVAPPLPRARLSPAQVVTLQRSAGNAAVARLLRQADDEDAAIEPAATDEAAGGEHAAAGGEVVLAPIAIPAPQPVEVEVYAPGPNLQGKTNAAYTSTDAVITPNPPRAARTTGCPDCGSDSCIRVRGAVSATFSSNPTVTLPDLDGRGFTDCQLKNAEKFVKDVLAPHEQLHVHAFRTNFDGAWRKAFDLKVCDAGEATDRIKAIYDQEFADRKAKADAASADLDANGKNIFTWDMDDGCPAP
jgi:hypothetical protein